MPVRNFLAILVFAIALVGGFARIIAGPPGPVWMKAPQMAGYEPAKIKVEVHVTPIATDSVVLVTLVGEGWGTSATAEGDGVPMTRLYNFEFKDVPAGEYELKATIGSLTQVRAVDRRTVKVVERGH